MDDVKKMLIDSILHRGAHYSSLYWEYSDEEDEANVRDGLLSKEELIRKREERERKNIELRDKTYF